MFSYVLVPLLTFHPLSCLDLIRDGLGEIDAASLSFDFIFAILYLALSILCIAALAIARTYRRAFALLLVSLICSIVKSAALITKVMADTCSGSNLDDGVVVGGSMAAFFYYWSLPLFFFAFCLLLRFRAEKAIRYSNSQKDSGNQKPIFSSAWSSGYLLISSFLLLFGTTTSALYTNYLRIETDSSRIEDAFVIEMEQRADRFGGSAYTFDAFWFISAFFLGAFAYTANKVVRESGLEVKVLKIMLYVVFPLYALRILADFIFTIVLSPLVLEYTGNNIKAAHGAFLAQRLITNALHGAAAMVLLICGCKRSLWIEGLGQGAQANNPLQPTYPTQVVYALQPVYQVQSGYAAQSTFPVQPNQLGQPIYATHQTASTSQPQERQPEPVTKSAPPEGQTNPSAKDDQSGHKQ